MVSPSTKQHIQHQVLKQDLYDRRSYFKTWCCRCCFVDGDTIVDLTLKLDVVDVVTKQHIQHQVLM
jgi:hypothetical protein